MPWPDPLLLAVISCQIVRHVRKAAGRVGTDPGRSAFDLDFKTLTSGQSPSETEKADP